MDNWVQGMGLAAGEASEQEWSARVLSGLQELPSGHFPVHLLYPSFHFFFCLVPAAPASSKHSLHFASILCTGHCRLVSGISFNLHYMA